MNIILKKYKDSRINEELKDCLKIAVNDEEYDLRYDKEYGMGDFTILMENIDKMLDYVNNGYKGELRLNSNIWWICEEALENILKLYGLEFRGIRPVTEAELVYKIGE